MAFAMVVIALRRGSKVATAMEARGVGGNQRTWARRSTVGRADLVALLVSVGIVSVALVAAALAGTFWAVWA